MIFQKFLQNNKWQHKDPAVRLEAIAELSHGTEPSDEDALAAAKILIELARTDSDTAVRVASIAHLNAPEVLQELIQLAKDIRAARQRGEEQGLSEDEIAFYVDGKETVRAKNPGMHAPMFIVLSNSLNGPGPVNKGMYVDSVRVGASG